MSEFKNKVVWITGASSGIGEALAYEVARQQATLILSARRIQELERVKAKCESLGSVCHIIPIDLTKPLEISAAVQKAFLLTQKIDILVNNGGVSQRSLVEETPTEVDRKLFEVNFWGAVELTKQVLPSMIAQRSGHIVAVSSIAGKFGFSMRSAYSASKHALYGFFESLRVETHHRNIKVTMVCPGRVHTNISLHAITRSGSEHGIMDHGQDGGIKAEECARQIVKAIRKNKKEVLIGGKELLMVYFKRFCPPIFYFLVTRVKPT